MYIIETICQNCGCRFEIDEDWFYQLDIHFCDGYCEDEWYAVQDEEELSD